MSQRALLLAVRNYLREERGYSDRHCEVTYDGKPIAVWAGSTSAPFVAVHPAAWAGTGGDELYGMQEEYGIDITVSVLAGQVPHDRIGPNLLVGPAGESLDEELEAVRALLHKDKGAYPVLALANETIGASANGFIEPLRFRSGGVPAERGASWFSAVSKVTTNAPVGISQTLSFGGAKRIQPIAEQT